MRMKCPMCAGAELSDDTQDVPYVDKGELTVLAGVTGEFCPACGEVVLGPEESTRVSAAMLEFNREVNAAAVDPQFIASVRKKLALALVKLLKVLDKHPELLGEVRAA